MRESTSFERIGSGHPELDTVLGGGFPAHSLNIIMGPPGTGKTVLAQQMLFHNAARGRPVVFLSTVSEPLTKVVTYLQRFGFYDEALMFDGSVVYEDLAPQLLAEGVGVVVSRVQELIRELGPAVVVVDSFKAVHDLAGSTLEMRRLSSELAGVVAAYDTTTFLVGEYAPGDVVIYPEFAVADGVLQLTRVDGGKRDERSLRVLKLRGSGYREGLHAFTIDDDGIRVYPRLVTPPAPARYEAIDERVTTGVDGFDALLDGGWWRGSSSLLMGAAGVGKTTFGMAFALEGASLGEPSLFLNFQENPVQLARTIRGLGVDLEEQRGKGLHLRYMSPVEIQIDAVVVELFRIVEAEGIRRVVIDSLSDLALAADTSERFHDYLYSITQHLATQRVTSLMTLETRSDPGLRASPDTRFNSILDAMVELRIDFQVEPARRTLRVLKARGIRHPLEGVPVAMEDGRLRALAGVGAS